MLRKTERSAEPQTLYPGTVGRTEWLGATMAVATSFLLVEPSGADGMGKAVSKACWENSAQVKPRSTHRQAVTQSHPTPRRMRSPQHGTLRHIQVKLSTADPSGHLPPPIAG